jgi:hypothetical protein
MISGRNRKSERVRESGQFIGVSTTWPLIKRVREK